MSIEGLSFANPPLVEVSFSVQFQPMQNFHAGVLGLTWSKFRDRYPSVKEAPEVHHEIEIFGALNRQPVPRFKFLDQAPSTRLLCFSEDHQYIVQLQKDRFIFNWVKQSGTEYPRYKVLKQKFTEELNIFIGSIEENTKQLPSYDQVEMTYINKIDKQDRNVCEIMHDLPGDGRMPSSVDFEALSQNIKHIIKSRSGEKIGRMHTNIEYPVEINEHAGCILLKYIARAHLPGKEVTDVLDTFDFLRESINDSFAAMTQEVMHKEWNRQDD